MPLYEGLSTGDKNVVILDIGAAYTKCGVAGETSPRCIIPSELKDDKTGKVRKLWAYRSEDELYENLKDFLFILYFRSVYLYTPCPKLQPEKFTEGTNMTHLLTNPKDRRLVVCESLLCPALFRETLAKVLFKHYEVSSVMFASGHLTSLLTLGVNTGLVMDVGYTETLVVPIYEGIPVLKAIQSLPNAGKAIHERIKVMLLDTGKLSTSDHEERPVAENPEILTPDVLEDIKVRCCFVTNLKRAKKIHKAVLFGEESHSMPTPPPGVQYPLDGGSVLHVDGKVREHACEVMFEQDNEQQSISTLLLDAILECPLDMRIELSRNIVIIGGTSMLPGFLHRIQLELYNLMKQDRYQNKLAMKKFKFHQPPAKANYTAWLGGALYGALETLPSKSVSKESYAETGNLPDWCTITS